VVIATGHGDHETSFRSDRRCFASAAAEALPVTSAETFSACIDINGDCSDEDRKHGAPIRSAGFSPVNNRIAINTIRFSRRCSIDVIVQSGWFDPHGWRDSEVA
jgi:hypothetical protein